MGLRPPSGDAFQGISKQPHWSGISEPDERYPDSNGFVVLDSVPATAPKVVPHLGLFKFPELKKRHFQSEKMKERAKSIHLEGSPEWLVEVVTTGKLPTRGPTVNSIPDRAQGYGTVETVGAQDRLLDIPVVRCISSATFNDLFALPVDVEEDRLARLDRMSRVVTPDTEARPIQYISKTRKRMDDLIGKVKAHRATLSKGAEDDIEVSSSESESEREQEPNPRKRQRQRTTQNEEKEELPEDSWGADFKMCKIGSYAVINSMYGDSSGLSVSKVTIQLSKKILTLSIFFDTLSKIFDSFFFPFFFNRN